MRHVEKREINARTKEPPLDPRTLHFPPLLPTSLHDPSLISQTLLLLSCSRLSFPPPSPYHAGMKRKTYMYVYGIIKNIPMWRVSVSIGTPFPAGPSSITPL